MHLLKNEYVGQLRLGASTTIAQYVLPPILARFTEKYPQIEVSLIDTNFTERRAGFCMNMPLIRE